MNESLKLSLRKAVRELTASVLLTALLAALGFLADPVALAAVFKDPPPQLLMLVPAINFAARVAIDQIRHRKQG